MDKILGASMDKILGWQVTDPDGNVLESGEVAIIEVNILDELLEYLTDLQPEGD